MTDFGKKQSSAVFIIIIIVLMVTFVFFIGKNFNAFDEYKLSSPKKLDNKSLNSEIDIASEIGPFRALTRAQDYLDHPGVVDTQRTLATFYNRRAYSGAPPHIPHDIESDINGSSKSCHTCHKNGGYVEKFKAYAPLTPHPELTNCQQCHVPITSLSLFRESTWKPENAPRGKAWLPNSPPSIPHSLHMRENCLSCHGGASAVKEIRTTHPERTNCRQCHVEGSNINQDSWQRSRESNEDTK